MSYSLFELNEYIRQVLALNFKEPVWVRCELAQVKMSRGHCYLELVEKNEDGSDILAQGGGVIWQRQLLQLRHKIGKEFDALLQDGMQVLLQAKLEFHERYGLKLMVTDIDPAYTLGKMELQKQATVRHLQKLGLMEKNRELPLPVVVQRIAVISSETAAGLQDFMEQLSSNAYGYQFKATLFPAAMQGVNVTKEINSRLRQIEKKKTKFDAVVIIRGGGAKLDLAAFDGQEVCQAVAEMPLPIIVGIGHEVDETVLDLVAHTSLKTPTAVAEFLLQRNMLFEAELLEFGNAVKYFAEKSINQQRVVLERHTQGLEIQSLSLLKREKLMLEFIGREIPVCSSRYLKNEIRTVESLENAVELLRPETAFRRGFSMSSKDGKIITSSEQLADGDEILTQLKKGNVRSTVKK